LSVGRSVYGINPTPGEPNPMRRSCGRSKGHTDAQPRQRAGQVWPYVSYDWCAANCNDFAAARWLASPATSAAWLMMRVPFLVAVDGLISSTFALPPGGCGRRPRRTTGPSHSVDEAAGMPARSVMDTTSRAPLSPALWGRIGKAVDPDIQPLGGCQIRQREGGPRPGA
jgi:hypothetical protein